MPHDHKHDHRSATARALAIALALTGGFLAVEVVAGLLTGSLALLADAGHMLSDTVSLVVALVAVRLAARPETAVRTLRAGRAGGLSALFNGVTLVAVSVWIFIEAAGRMSDPPDVLGGWLLAVAGAGLLVNLAAARVLSSDSGESLNRSAALRHVLGDLAGSAGVIVAAVVILTTGWRYADPLISIAIGLLILGSSWPILRDSTRILLEATPRGLDATEVGEAMAASTGIREVHDLHVWTITSGFPALSAHVLVAAGDDCHARRRELQQLLRDRFGIEHTTLQVDHERDPELLELELPGRGAAQ
ncbi:MAG: cation diffusion facilitator family transporter [Thermoleophilaceae bacterium]